MLCLHARCNLDDNIKLLLTYLLTYARKYDKHHSWMRMRTLYKIRSPYVRTFHKVTYTYCTYDRAMMSVVRLRASGVPMQDFILTA